MRVTGARRALRRGARDEHAASSVIEADTLGRPGATVAEALGWQPGVQIAATGSPFDLSTAFVRGATSAQLPVYLAGVRVNDEITGGADLSTLPTTLVRRVEIYRGSAPIEADRAGIGGAVFVDPRLPRGPIAVGSAGAGSFGYRTLRLVAGTGHDEAATLVAVGHERGANDYPYVDDRGTRLDPRDDRVLPRPNADASQTSAWAVSRLRRGEASLTLLASAFAREQGAPGQLLAPALEARSTQRRSIGAARGVVPCGAGCTLSIASAALVAATRLDDPLGELALGADRIAIDARRFAPSARVDAAPARDVRLTVAVDAATERLERAPSGGPREGFSRRSARAAARLAVEADEHLEFAATGAIEPTRTVDDRGASSEATPPAARLSARLGGPLAALVASASTQARVPTLGELHGVSPTIRGNAALRPESGVGVDAGARAARSLETARVPVLVEADVFAFARTVDDLVAYRRASLQAVRPYNVGRARVTGLEAQGALTLAHALRLEQSASLLEASDVTPGRATSAAQLPFRARLTTFTRASLATASIGPLASASVGAQLAYQASRYADDAGLVIIPAQRTVDVDVQGVVPVAGGVDATVRLRAANVTSASRFDAIGYPLPPRQFFVELELRHEPR